MFSVFHWVKNLRSANGDDDEAALRETIQAAICRANAVADEVMEKKTAAGLPPHHRGHKHG